MHSSTPSSLSSTRSVEDDITEIKINYTNLETKYTNLLKEVDSLKKIMKIKTKGVSGSNEIIEENNDNDGEIELFKYHGADGYLEFLNSIFPDMLEKKCKSYPKLRQMRSSFHY
jgi:hypothetical protein